MYGQNLGHVTFNTNLLHLRLYAHGKLCIMYVNTHKIHIPINIWPQLYLCMSLGIYLFNFFF